MPGADALVTSFDGARGCWETLQAAPFSFSSVPVTDIDHECPIFKLPPATSALSIGGGRRTKKEESFCARTKLASYDEKRGSKKNANQAGCLHPKKEREPPREAIAISSLTLIAGNLRLGG